MPDCREDAAVRKEDIKRGLARLGAGKGEGLITHSSLKSFGFVDGGPATVIAALLEVITGEGTLIMPTFNHGEPFREDPGACFDPLRTPTKNGAIPEYFRKMPGVMRSLNPTHPFAGFGKNARRYLENHHLTFTMGADSPAGLLFSDGGFCLLIGVGCDANTFHHVVETMNGAPCLGYRTEAYPVRLPVGRVIEGRTWSFRSRKCPLSGLYPAEMEKRGLFRRTRVGRSVLTLFSLGDCYEVYSRLLREGRGKHPPCGGCGVEPGCTGSRANIVESDLPGRDIPAGGLSPGMFPRRLLPGGNGGGK